MPLVDLVQAVADTDNRTWALASEARQIRLELSRVDLSPIDPGTLAPGERRELLTAALMANGLVIQESPGLARIAAAAPGVQLDGAGSRYAVAVVDTELVGLNRMTRVCRSLDALGAVVVRDERTGTLVAAHDRARMAELAQTLTPLADSTTLLCLRAPGLPVVERAVRHALDYERRTASRTWSSSGGGRISAAPAGVQPRGNAPAAPAHGPVVSAWRGRSDASRRR